MTTMITPGRQPDVGDIVTRGRSKLRWVVDSVRTDGPTDTQWATLRPIGDGRYTWGSAPLGNLHIVEVDA